MHLCVMQARRAVCYCAAGYKLGLDKASCEPTGKKLYAELSIYNYSGRIHLCIFISIFFPHNQVASPHNPIKAFSLLYIDLYVTRTSVITIDQCLKTVCFFF